MYVNNYYVNWLSIVSRGVTVDLIWNGKRICWNLKDPTRGYAVQFTITQEYTNTCQQSRHQLRYLVAASTGDVPRTVPVLSYQPPAAIA
jgi:hypothetical protein